MVFRKGAEAPWFQLGIVNFGPSRCASQTPGLYARVTSFLSWIENNLEPLIQGTSNFKKDDDCCSPGNFRSADLPGPNQNLDDIFQAPIPRVEIIGPKFSLEENIPGQIIIHRELEAPLEAPKPDTVIIEAASGDSAGKITVI